MRFLIQLLLVVLLAGCDKVDIHQAELCGEVAKILFADGEIGRVTSALVNAAIREFVAVRASEPKP